MSISPYASMSISPYASQIIQQVEDNLHTIADIERVKLDHERLYGNNLDDQDYVSVCEALTILQQTSREGEHNETCTNQA